MYKPKKKRSIVQYMMGLLALATIVISVAVMIYVYFFAKEAIDYELQTALTEINGEKSEYVSLQDGKLAIEEEFDEKEENTTALVISEDGEVLHGEYPQGAPQNVEVRLLRVQKVICGGEIWYVRDRFKGKIHIGDRQKRQKIYVRIVVRKKEMPSEYKTMEIFAYVSIIVLGVLIMGIGFLFSRKIKRSMEEMCRSAENIGKDSNLSQRIAYEGSIYELDVLNEANNRMLDRMESILKQQEQFNSDVAHELRTPVSVTMAQCEYATEHLKNQEEVENAFHVIYRQSRKINEIITQLLYLSRLEQGKSNLQLEVVDLQTIAESVCECETENPAHEAEIRTKLRPAETMGDISLIMIALQNLLNNAIKYADGKPIEIETGRRDGHVFVSVRDYGRGIEPEDMEHIFKRFYKEDKSRNSEGYGLGLSITAKIMELCDGEVTVESKEGEGSIFTLLFRELK